MPSISGRGPQRGTYSMVIGEPGPPGPQGPTGTPGTDGTQVEYATVAAVTLAIIPLEALFVRTAGYASAGDGGGALYARVGSMPAHTGSIQSLDGAWWEIAEETYSVRMFGARADSTGAGLGTDDRQAFQNAINAAIIKRKRVVVPGGAYRIGTPGVTVNLAALANITDTRVSIDGDRGATLIYFDNGDYSGLSWLGGAGSGTSVMMRVSGMNFRKSDILGTGLRIDNAAFFTVEHCYLSGWNTGVELTDCLSARLASVQSRFNNYGLSATRIDGSQPNALSLEGCVLGNNQENGLVLTRPGNFNVFGGSIESNGNLGVSANKGGAYISEGPSQAGCSLGLFGVYLEHNVGIAQILISNSSGHQATYVFSGCSFQRISNTIFTTNIVRAVGTTQMVLAFQGCAFKRLGSYVADAARPYIDVSGAAAARVHLDWSNYQMDAIEAWTGHALAATANNRSWYILANSAVLVSRISVNGAGDTIDQAMATITIPANAMGPNGTIRVTSLWSYTNSASTKRFRGWFNGLAGSAFQAASGTTTASARFQFEVNNRGVTNSQVGASTTLNSFGTSGGVNMTSAVDTTAAVDLVLASSWTAAASAETITLEKYTVELFYGA